MAHIAGIRDCRAENFKPAIRSFANVMDEFAVGRAQRAMPAIALDVGSGRQRAVCGLTIGRVEGVCVFHGHEVNRQSGCLKSSAKGRDGDRFRWPTTPEARVRGTSAAGRAMRSWGSNSTCVVPSEMERLSS